MSETGTGGAPGEGPDDDRFAGTRESLRRARSRLNALEFILLGGAAIFSLVGGALLAYLISAGSDLPFRSTWFVTSIVIFLVPAGIVYIRELRQR